MKSRLETISLSLCNASMNARTAASAKRGTSAALPLLRTAYKITQSWHVARLTWIAAEFSAEEYATAIAYREECLANIRDEATWIALPIAA